MFQFTLRKKSSIQEKTKKKWFQILFYLQVWLLKKYLKKITNKIKLVFNTNKHIIIMIIIIIIMNQRVLICVYKKDY